VKKLYDALSCRIHLDAKAMITFLPYITEKGAGLQLLPIFEKEKVTDFSIYPILLSSILWVVFEDELSKELRDEKREFFFQMGNERKNK
jgi:hypothetical protein